MIHRLEDPAAVLTWTFYELSQQPELYQRVRREIDDVLQGRAPTYEDMGSLPLLRNCRTRAGWLASSRCSSGALLLRSTAAP